MYVVMCSDDLCYPKTHVYKGIWKLEGWHPHSLLHRWSIPNSSWSFLLPQLAFPPSPPSMGEM